MATSFKQLIQQAGAQPPARTAVVHPCDVPSLQGALDALAERFARGGS